jgi:hypothetical protein
MPINRKYLILILAKGFNVLSRFFKYNTTSQSTQKIHSLI